MFGKKFLSMVLLVGMLIAQSVPYALAATDCDHAQFVSDLTAPDGSSFAPGAAFTKTWRLMNIGTCEWTTAYNLVWVGGDSMGAPLPAKFPVSVAPGQMVDISVNLTAPATGGHYKALFKISNASGGQFGIGDSAIDPFWVDINVVQTSAVIYDFVANAPYAQWKSGAGVQPFPGTSGDQRGFAYQVNNPHLEDDSFDSSPGLLTVPQNKFNGYIQAAYPEFQVQQGDHLQTLVNCEFNAKNCYATFRIDYLLPNGVQRTLWSWKEAHDKRFYRADIDLSALAGQKVRFVFMLLSSGFASGDRAIWGSPRVVRAGTTQPPGPPPTLTPLPPLPPTPTPLGQPPPTVQPSGCDKAAFVTDVTVQDGTTFTPGAAFTKTWRLRNAGSCVWTTSYKLVYYSGEQMGAPTMVNLPWGATSGQTVDISVNMVAPSTAGEYRGFWILANASGQFFGIGADAAQPVWVEINVSGEAPFEGGYPLWLNACSAEWKSGAGPLPCPGVEGDRKGFIIPLNYTHLEDGTMGPAPSLLISPENKYNGYIQGIFPTFTVQPGDHFDSGVGCEYSYSCYVTFRLDYMTANGGIFNFWSWREQNDQKNYHASVDLTPLAGRSVRFILTVLATGSAAGDRVRWIGPSIVRVDRGTPPTITPAPPTITPIPNDWLTYTNTPYGFEFKYPLQAQLSHTGDNSIRVDLPFTPGTNLHEKYLETVVRDNVTPCQSPLATSSMLGSSETVVINGITFLKQTGGDGAAGNLYEWVAYSTPRNNACISMDFVLHSVTAGSSPIFDKAAESAVFTQMMGTFGWSTPTITAIPPVVVPSPNIRKLFMIDASNGWAIGDVYVLRTYDGGATWFNVTVSGISTIRNGFFPDFNKGWILTADSIYRTVDGGITWAHYNVPFNGGYMQFLDDANGFVLSGELSGMHKHAVQLYQTTDGGATWTLKYANDPSQPNNTLPFGGIKYGMTFRDTATGWVSGYIPSPGTVYLYKTMDSGVTWAQQSLALPPGYESAEVIVRPPVFFGSNDAILPLWTSSSTGREMFIYLTHDGGATWTRSSGFARTGESIDIPSIRDVFSWDWTGFFNVTNDSGASWRQITPNVNFGSNFRTMDFISATTGWVFGTDSSGSTALYRTTDGGYNWTPLFGNILTSTPPSPTPTPTATQTSSLLLPDLTIAGMRIELQNTSCLMPGDPMGVRVWIKNNGQAAASSFVVNVNGANYLVNGLAAGETVPVFFTGYSNPVTASVDSTNTIAEIDENNNSRSEMVPVPTAPLPCASPTPTVNPTELAQSIVQALNARNFVTARSLMDQTFMFSYWQSQGAPTNADLAIENLRTAHLNDTRLLIPDVNKDLSTLLGDLNPYSIMGLDPDSSQALFVSDWGLDGTDEALLYVTRRPDGSWYWYGVLIAKGGFGATSDGVTHESFCADTRIPILIEQLKGSMNQSNGDMFAGLVSPVHGVNVHLWAYHAPVNFTTTTARTAFTSTQVYQWGSGPAGGTEYGTGTFSQIIQPKMLEVLNAPNMETYCDDLTKVFPLSRPWPYTNIRYYNLFKPGSSQFFDFRTWLIGFEYIDNQPYLHSMVTIVWEP